MDSKVCVLMATYNGEKYVLEMLESIKNQTYSEFVCYIHDDGSTDSTCKIIDEFCKVNDNFIRLKSGSCGGAKSNYLYMLKEIGVQFKYCMFCDQDDVWLPNKIEKSVEAIKKLESDNPAVSALVYCDMKVVDENLKEIASSFIKYNALSVDEITIDRAVMKGYAAGCTMIINNTLAKASVVEDTNNIIMHDWWVMLIASVIGKIEYLDEPLALYRQHGTNTLGAKHITRSSRIREICSRVISGRQMEITRSGLYQRIRQLACCSCIDAIGTDYQELIDGAVSFEKKRKIDRFIYVLKFRLYQNKWSALWTCICS